MSCRRKHKKIHCNLPAALHSHPYGTPVYSAHTPEAKRNHYQEFQHTICIWQAAHYETFTSTVTEPATKLLVTPVSWPNSVICCLHFQDERETRTLKMKPAGPSTTLAKWRHIPEESKSHKVSKNKNTSLWSSGNYVIFDVFYTEWFRRKGKYIGTW